MKTRASPSEVLAKRLARLHIFVYATQTSIMQAKLHQGVKREARYCFSLKRCESQFSRGTFSFENRIFKIRDDLQNRLFKRQSSGTNVGGDYC